MTENYDYVQAQHRIWENLNQKDYVPLVQELENLLTVLESSNATQYLDYIEYKFLLHQVFVELKDLDSSIRVLRELNKHFLENTTPLSLAPRGQELYMKTWTYLGYLLAENKNPTESREVLQRCLPLLTLIRGAESQEVETVKWYILSVEKYGRIMSDEPETLYVDDSDEEGLRCSFCLTGQVDVVTGPSVYICRNCINLFKHFTTDGIYTRHVARACGNAKCSFSCKPSSAEAALFPGAGVYICTNCLKLCNEITDEKTLPLD